MAYTKYYIQINNTSHVSFSAPSTKYTALDEDLGLLESPLTGSRKSPGTVYENGAFRIRAILANKKSVFLICDPDKITDVLGGSLNGKACNGSTVKEVTIPLHRVRMP